MSSIYPLTSLVGSNSISGYDSLKALKQRLESPRILPHTPGQFVHQAMQSVEDDHRIGDPATSAESDLGRRAFGHKHSHTADPFQQHSDTIQIIRTSGNSDTLEQSVVGLSSLSPVRRPSTQTRERCYMPGQHPSRVDKSSRRLSNQYEVLGEKNMTSCAFVCMSHPKRMQIM